MKPSESTLETGKPTTGSKTGMKASARLDEINLSNFLIETYKVFRETKTVKGKQIAPSVTGTPSSIAAYGFVNLPAELIAALTGSDGGKPAVIFNPWSFK